MNGFNKSCQDETIQIMDANPWTAIWWKRFKKQLVSRWMIKSKRTVAFAIAGIVLVILAAWIASTYVQTNIIPFYRVYHRNEFIGTVSSLEEIEHFYAKRLRQEQSKHPSAHIKLKREGIRFVADSGFKARPTTSETIAKLDKLTTAYAEGVKLKVNGQTIGYVKDKAMADKIWRKIKARYVSSNQGKYSSKRVQVLSSPKRSMDAIKAMSRVEFIEFRERVSVEDANIAPGQLFTLGEAIRKLTTGHTRKMKYTVKLGDTISSIVKAMNVSPETIYRNNPSVGEEWLKEGQVLDLTESKPLITVKTVETYSEYLVTEPQEIIRKDPMMRSGKSKVVQAGNQGLKLMSYRLTKDNGRLSHEEWIDHKMIEPATPKIVIRGTKVIRGNGTGSFGWPVKDVELTSKFGKRWGRMHQGVDMISPNRSIKASDEGTVLFSGVKNGYGNCIIINHRNGYKTLYGHLSEIHVNVGDVVEKGQNIGLMGSSGNSTGTHLHFEIIKGDTEQDPLRYLPDAT